VLRTPVPTGRHPGIERTCTCLCNRQDRPFAAELISPATKPEEQIIALKFLLHFVGDLHQPLHAADDHDRGGNSKRVSFPGAKGGNLHHFWDTVFVQQLGPNVARIASDLNGRIIQRDIQAWSKGEPSDWVMESFSVAKEDAYGRLPQPNARGTFQLSADYIAMATNDVALQLSKAVVRLALLLNKTLGPPQ